MLSALFDKQKLKMDINTLTIKLAHMYSQVSVSQSLLLFGSWVFGCQVKGHESPIKAWWEIKHNMSWTVSCIQDGVIIFRFRAVANYTKI